MAVTCLCDAAKLEMGNAPLLLYNSRNVIVSNILIQGSHPRIVPLR